MNNSFSCSVKSLDFAALLYSLGFDMIQFEVVHHINMENKDKRDKSAIFEFSTTSKSGLTLQKIKDNYILPEKGKAADNIGQFAKLTSHNYQILKSVITDNRPLQQIEGLNYYLLKNMNGNDPTGQKTNYFTSDISIIAIASALGYSISSYIIDNNKLIVYFDEDIKEIVDCYNNDDDNDYYDNLTVLVAMMKNRKMMMSETHAKHTLHITNGHKQVIVNKNMSPELNKKVIDFIN